MYRTIQMKIEGNVAELDETGRVIRIIPCNGIWFEKDFDRTLQQVADDMAQAASEASETAMDKVK